MPGNGRHIAPGNETHIERRARKAVPLLFRAPGYGSGGRRPTVEAAFDGRDVRSRGHPKCELERVLVGLSSAVDEKDAGEVESREPHEFFSSPHANLHVHGVGLKVTGFGLLRECARPGGMRVPEGGHGVAAVHVEDPLTPAVREPHALCRDDLDRVLSEHAREIVVIHGARRGGRCGNGTGRCG